MTTYIVTSLVIIIVAAFCWYMKNRLAKDELHIKNAGIYDPYIDHVRAMRALPGVDPEVAVSIQEPETGEFFYYPKGSEVRFKKDSSDKIHMDL